MVWTKNTSVESWVSQRERRDTIQPNIQMIKQIANRLKMVVKANIGQTQNPIYSIWYWTRCRKSPECKVPTPSKKMATSLTLPKSNLHLPKLVGGVKSIQPLEYPSTSTFARAGIIKATSPRTSKLLGTEKLNNEILLSQQKRLAKLDRILLKSPERGVSHPRIRERQRQWFLYSSSYS